MENPICYYCNKAITWSNWTLDRIDNTRSHSIDNIVLSCRNCNVKKKDKETRIFFYDFETYPEMTDDNAHNIYNTGLTEYNKRALNNGDYKTLLDNTEVFYRQDSFERFENWIIDSSEDV